MTIFWISLTVADSKICEIAKNHDWEFEVQNPLALPNRKLKSSVNSCQSKNYSKCTLTSFFSFIKVTIVT